MRSAIAISLLFIYLIAMLKPISPLIEYYVRYDYISKVLCENKDKPQMHCNGKCYLNKQNLKIAKEEDKTQLPSFNLKIEDYPVGFITFFSVYLFYQQLRRFSALNVNDYTFNFKDYIFHPPKY